MTEQLPFKPWGNMALIEVEKEYKEIVRNDAGEQNKKGVLRSWSMMQHHLTESGGYTLSDTAMREYAKTLEAMVGRVVSYQEYADSGRKLEIEGREFVVVPWYRITGLWDKKLNGEAK